MNNSGSEVVISRKITVPCPVKLERFRRNPDLGPGVLFFSGGSALKGVSEEITEYTHNSIHIMTSFDSGGSSAEIRKAFRMLSVGDIRARLISLADRSFRGNPEIYALFSHRLSKDSEAQVLKNQLHQLSRGTHPLMKKIQQPLKDIISTHFDYFLKNMPTEFNLRGASLGNLILTGGFLNNNRKIEPVIYLFSRLVEVRGNVCAVTDSDYQLAAICEDGEIIVGQHEITGKEVAPLGKKISRVFISGHPSLAKEIEIKASSRALSLISQAELVVYSFGSFYSSLIANILPDGISQAISENSCPKVYIPNTTEDPELYGVDPVESALILLEYLKKNGIRTADVLNTVFVDRKYTPTKKYISHLKKEGVNVVSVNLTGDNTSGFFSPSRVTQLLLSLC
ncbi:MAG: GAK system CofD-like protein [Deltaproteobacteria bacterium]|nr:GAK system CofD-like protein [Deltaproteobacteria bacterium]